MKPISWLILIILTCLFWSGVVGWLISTAINWMARPFRSMRKNNSSAIRIPATKRAPVAESTMKQESKTSEYPVLDTDELKRLCECVVRDIGNHDDCTKALDDGWANLTHKSLPELKAFLFQHQPS